MLGICGASDRKSENTEVAKNLAAVSSRGPTPTATSLNPGRVPPSPSGLGSDKTIPAPVRPAPRDGPLVFAATDQYATGR